MPFRHIALRWIVLMQLDYSQLGLRIEIAGGIGCTS